MLQVLSGYKFGSFDILTDDEVRQGERATNIRSNLIPGFDGRSWKISNKIQCI